MTACVLSVLMFIWVGEKIDLIIIILNVLIFIWVGAIFFKFDHNYSECVDIYLGR